VPVPPLDRGVHGVREGMTTTAAPADPDPMVEGRRITLTGTVQGVGFRPFVYRAAHAGGVAGRVRNDASGVTIEAFAPAAALDRFEQTLRTEHPLAARVESLGSERIPVEPVTAFEIAPSGGAADRRVAIPPDLAICDDCARELADPADRRHGYPFTNCTNCGPRFTIALDVPYDRPATTMAGFPMCDACRREYEDPLDRRFHAQPNACPTCGPRVTALVRSTALARPSTGSGQAERKEGHLAGESVCGGPSTGSGRAERKEGHLAGESVCGGPSAGSVEPRMDGSGWAERKADSVRGEPVEPRAGWAPANTADPIAFVASELRAGRIAAVKGLGGYHLACDATSSAAVRVLRERKRREEKPLAVMVRDLADAHVLADLLPAEETLLASIERPIVLCRRRAEAPLAPELAPGSPIVGLLLPYAPLHHLLLAAAGRPLVMTSGNLSDEPIAFEDEDALARLGAIADVFLVHDRRIASRADDSVARVVAGKPLVMRRSRGFVPRPVRLRRPVARPILAVGAQLKNTFCLARGDEATLGPHVGDLDNLETYASFEAAVARLETFLALRPEAIACDLHPLYLSTVYARERAAALGVPLVEVQHHHAHVASAAAEHGLHGPVLGLAWDGTGLGTDGAAWGGELLLVEGARSTRLGTFRPVALAGGDRAIRDPWRIALAALLDAFEGAPPLDRIPLFAGNNPKERDVVRRMLAGSVNAPLAHGVGRLFDAAGALALGRPHARFEGQLAIALEAADGSHSPPASADSAAQRERGERVGVRGAAEAYPYDLARDGDLWQLDLRPLWRALASDVIARRNAALVSARFHEALADAGAELVRRAAEACGKLPVVLTGGCFQNARLAAGIVRRLDASFEVYQHAFVPPGDGGIALGQAVVADAALAQL
jgi:hydrogenase maturation protein HypF